MLSSSYQAVTRFFKRIFVYPYACFVLFLLLCTRLVAMVWVPLNDSTEARYAEIARIMLETGNWVTPMHHYGEPFWAKPPLSMWLSAYAMKLCGVSAFSARLPGLLLSIGVLCLIWQIARLRHGTQMAMNTVLILAGSLYFLLNAGTVMTEPALLFCMTLIVLAFWHAVMNKSALWGYLFFIGLGLGLLAKGPIALILTGMPLFIWIVWQKQWRAVWQHLPWITGSVLMLVIALPWYIWAEYRTPGFLSYFIMGEHIMRFLQPGWGGDKYGFAHVAPWGMIWLYLLLGTLPWCVAGLVWCGRHIKTLPALCHDHDGWMRYVLLCALVPLIFFTFSSNIIYPYVFPSLPPLALAASELVHRVGCDAKRHARIVGFASINAILFLILSVAFVLFPQHIAKSQDRMIAAYQQQPHSATTALVYWHYHADYSAQFYSSGLAVATLDPRQICQWFTPRGPHYLIKDSEMPRALPEWIEKQLVFVKKITVLKKTWTLFRLKTSSITCPDGVIT